MTRYELPDPRRLVNQRGRVVNPADHPFFTAHPVSAANVVAAYDAATPAQRDQGRRWYADAHNLARAMTGGNNQLGAILLACYSPQAAWPVNMYNAARAAAERRPLGPADGMISRAMQDIAREALAGATVEQVLRSPKTLAFARLIELGGDHPGDRHGQVAVDRHALTVATGHAVPEAGRSLIGKPRMHEYVADVFRAGALTISGRDGRVIAPYQVQAITWLVQQSASRATLTTRAADPDSGLAGAGARGHLTSGRRAWARWMDWARTAGLILAAGTTAL